MAALKEKLAEAVRQFPVLYDKFCRDFTDNSIKRIAWEDVAKQVDFRPVCIAVVNTVSIV